MIERAALGNFKAFRNLELEFRPLTLLFGPNNTGKSSILAPFRLLAQTLDAADPRVALLLDGPLGDFGTFKDVVYGNQDSRSISICLSGTSDNPFYSRQDGEHPVHWTVKVTFDYRPRRRQLILSEAEVSDQSGHLLTIGYVPRSDHHVITRLAGKEIPARNRVGTDQQLMLMHFLPHLTLYRRPSSGKGPLEGLLTSSALDDVTSRAEAAVWGLRTTLRTVEYISSKRSPPERTYHQTGEGRQRIGARGENWAGILVLDSSRTGGASTDLAKRLNRWLSSAGLASEVRLNWLSGRHYEVQIKHPITGEVENLADVGQGNSQVIPVLLGGYRLEAGDTYLVEEPEIHLHPRAQAALGDYFVELHQNGVNAVVETHSEYLLLRLQQHVAAGKIDPDQIGFYYVDAAQNGSKTVEPLTLDSEARFEQGLREGFFPERLEEARKLARLRGR